MELRTEGIPEEHVKAGISEIGRKISDDLRGVYIVVFDDWEDGCWIKKLACEKALNDIVRRHTSGIEIYRDGSRVILSNSDIEKIEKELKIENTRAKELSGEYWSGWWKGTLYAIEHENETGLKERARAGLEAIEEGKRKRGNAEC